MGLQCCHIQDPFASCTFNFNQPKKLLVSHAHIFLLHLYNVITNNFRIVHTNNQIHFLKTKLPFLAVWLSRLLVFLMGLQYCHIQDPFPLCNSFFTQPNKMLASHASMHIYLYSKPCILTIHHIYIVGYVLYSLHACVCGRVRYKKCI
jgi:hypothetical protein